MVDEKGKVHPPLTERQSAILRVFERKDPESWIRSNGAGNWKPFWDPLSQRSDVPFESSRKKRLDHA